MARRLRFAFAITKGPNKGLACAGWRIWTRANSTYITAKPFGGIWKVSLHGEDSWRLALTKENEQSEQPMVRGGHRNAPWVFEPAQFHGGGRLAFAIQVNRNSLLPQDIDSREVIVEVADRWDRLTTLYIWMTQPGIAFDTGTHRLVG